MSSSLSYRPDIDGLRAIAVLAVILCHAGLSVFSGGYVGVDIFFVISGYLITTIVMRELGEGRFSARNFWERRIRRILPALIIVMVASLVLGWLFYLPPDYKLLGQQTAAQSVFSSNILFKLQSGYFDVDSQTKPLLHTWSLAVEEQFYLFFPIIILIFARFGARTKTVSFWSFFVLSFAAAAFIVHNSSSSAFYLLPFRAWEFMIGSALVLHAAKMNPSPRVAHMLGLAGIILILAPVFLYDEDTLFPGLLALPPCLGTALLILAHTGHRTFISKILSLRPVVFIGLISYPLYLWHWPTFTFLKYSQLITITPLIIAGALTLITLLSVATWAWIETPIRKKRILPRQRHAYIFGLGSLLLLGALGLAIHLNNGIPQRLSPHVTRLADGAGDFNPYRTICDKRSIKRLKDGNLCQFNSTAGTEPDFILWGDSMADSLAPAFYTITGKTGKNGYVATANGCPPILGFAHRMQGGGYDCRGYNRAVLDFIIKNNIKTVFMAGNWTGYMIPNNDEYYTFDPAAAQISADDSTSIPFRFLQATINEMVQNGVTKIYLVTDAPFAPFDPPRYLSMREFYGAYALPDTISLASHRQKLESTLEGYLKQHPFPHTKLVDMTAILCDDTACRTHDQDGSYYFNPGHLSTHGARQLIPLFQPLIP